MTQLLVISASLRSESNSRLLAQEAARVLQADGHEVSWLDLRDYPLPLCDGGAAYSHPHTQAVDQLIEKADAVLISTPIYNYDANAAVKNLIELTGRRWTDKVVGFLCAAGGMGSYMAIMSLANGLMLDFRCVVIPRFVYATSAAFADGGLIKDEIADRVAELAKTAARFGRLLKA